MQLTRRFEHGFTLLEVLLALLIMGILLMTSMRLLTDQERGARALKNYLEAHYSLFTAGKTVSDAIRMAETVEWVDEFRELKVRPLPNDSNLVPTLESYSIADLDRDGTKDLYWKRPPGNPQPLASYLEKWHCTEVEPGLWEVLLEANANGQRVTWRSVIRQRVFPQALSACISQSVRLPFLYLSF